MASAPCRARLPRPQPHHLPATPRDAGRARDRRGFRDDQRVLGRPSVLPRGEARLHRRLLGRDEDALPYAKTVGNRARIYGLNTIGLVRRGFSPDAWRSCAARSRYLLHSNTRPRDCPDRPRSLAAQRRSKVSGGFIRTSSRGVGLRPPEPPSRRSGRRVGQNLTAFAKATASLAEARRAKAKGRGLRVDDGDRVGQRVVQLSRIVDPGAQAGRGP